jgi:hypothetical protein
VSVRDGTICSPWSRTLLVKPRSGYVHSGREIEAANISPTSSFHDGETPNISHRSFTFDINPRLDDPESWADRCLADVEQAKINRRGCRLLAHRACAVAFACKHYVPSSSFYRRTLSDTTGRQINAAAGKITAALRQARELIARCGGVGWLGRMLELVDWAESFAAADQSLVDAATQYGVAASAIGGMYSHMHDNIESVFNSVLEVFGLARMHLAAVLRPHILGEKSIDQCLGSAPRIAEDFDCSHGDFMSEVSCDEFAEAFNVTRQEKANIRASILMSFESNFCQVKK